MTSQLCTTSCKVGIKYVGPIVIYEIIDPHNYLLMTLNGRILRGLFEHDRLKPSKHKDETRDSSKSSAIKANCEYRFKISLES